MYGWADMIKSIEIDTKGHNSVGLILGVIVLLCLVGASNMIRLSIENQEDSSLNFTSNI